MTVNELLKELNNYQQYTTVEIHFFDENSKKDPDYSIFAGALDNPFTLGDFQKLYNDFLKQGTKEYGVDYSKYNFDIVPYEESVLQSELKNYIYPKYYLPYIPFKAKLYKGEKNNGK